MGRPELPAREAAVRVVQTLRDAGHVAYFAGGCVRDALLGLEPKDYDVATDAHPPSVRQLFPGSRLVGEAFGVVLVRSGGHNIEVATFRLEGRYEDGRRPSEVHFTDAQHDAQRRDFTINGLFEDPLATDESHRIIDHVGGVADLKARILRTIGSPWARFDEDYLRLLRAARFAGRFRFELEPATRDAIVALSGRLSAISRERIGQEILWMLAGPQPTASLELVESLKLDAPALSETHRRTDLLTVRRLSPGSNPALLLAAWLLDRHAFVSQAADSPTMLTGRSQTLLRALARWRNALCLSNELRDAVRDMLHALHDAGDWPRMGVAGRKRLLARPAWPSAWQLMHALAHHPPTAAAIEAMQPQVDALTATDVAPPRLVSGDDLIQLGMKPGPRVGELLEAVYDAQLEGDITTRDDALAWVRQRL